MTIFKNIIICTNSFKIKKKNIKSKLYTNRPHSIYDFELMPEVARFQFGDGCIDEWIPNVKVKVLRPKLRGLLRTYYKLANFREFH